MGKTAGSNKSEKANKYDINKKDEEELRKKLSNANPNTDGTSNFLKIMGKIFKLKIIKRK